MSSLSSPETLSIKKARYLVNSLEALLTLSKFKAKVVIQQISTRIKSAKYGARQDNLVAS